MSKVYFTSDLARSAELFEAAGFSRLIVPGEAVALKIHFGEPGNNAYLKPAQVRPVTEKIKSLGGKPFYTDCNTLYKGPRKTTKEHLQVAIDHGYPKSVIPEEDDFETIKVNLKHFKKVFIGGVTCRTKTMLALTHFKGHEVTGFGGALKNLGMGLGTRQGKLKMHQDCANCAEAKSCKKNQTIEACWGGSSELVQEKIVEYAYGAVKGKKTGYVSYIVSVSPACDCYPFNDPPIVPDLGILASADPVAIDQACVNLVNKSAGKDIFHELYPETDWTVQLKYAEEIGMGKREYELISL